MAAIDWIKKYVGGGQGAGGWDIVSPEGVHVVCGLHQSQANDALRLIQTVLQPTCVPNIDTQRLDWQGDVDGTLWFGDHDGAHLGFDGLGRNIAKAIADAHNEAIDKAMCVPSPEPVNNDLPKVRHKPKTN